MKVVHASPFTAAFTVLANAIPLYGVLFWNWDIFTIFFLFWFENLAIGFFTLAQIIAYGLRRTVVDTPDEPRKNPFSLISTAFYAAFFIFHFGMFTMVHGAFVFDLFGDGMLTGAAMPQLHHIAAVFTQHGLWLAGLSITIAAMIAAFHQFTTANAYAEDERAAMASPYGRVVVLHIVIIFGGVAADALGQPVWALVLLIALKSAYDLAIYEFKLNEKEPE